MRYSIIGVGVLSLGAAAYISPSLSTSKPRMSPPSSTRAPRLFKDSRQSLAIARALGHRDIVLVVAAVTGHTDGAARDATRLGGEVRHRDDEVGYLRVRIPVDKATEFAESANVESAAADVDDASPNRLMSNGPMSAGPTARPAGDPNMLQAQQEQWPPKLGDYPLRNAYSPIKDIDAKEFLERNPTYDGRGVTIALLDGNLDLLLPEFQTAYTREGARVPKIADFLNTTDPRDDAAINAQWVNMQTEVDGASGRVTFQGKTFVVPRAGSYRIGLFDERRFNHPSNAAYIDQDVDRNGNPKGDDGLFGVLWDERTNDVWVDTNRDLSFADETALTDYAKRPVAGVFGKDDPKTPIRETIGFAVQTDPTNKFISLNLGIYQHASGIMGSVVGNRDPNGRIAGVAPGARLASVFYGVSNLHGAMEGLIRTFRDPSIDLIVFEQSVAMASIPYLLADGRHPLSIVAQRLAARYQKLMFVPGGNSPGFAIVAEDGLAPNVVSVGGYQSRDSYLANFGAYIEEYDNQHWGALSHGPSGIGQLKPDLLAPSGQISTDPGYRKGALRKGLFQLPPGYSVDGGTSTATPMAAGAAALVVSAAKQRNLKYDAPRLKAALQGSARYLPRIAAHQQGAGVVQVAAALAMLEKLQSTPMVTIESRAPVRTALSGLLATANEGVGIYERDGWKAGDRGERTIVLTRTSGPSEAMTFSLKWQGNDGTFTSGQSVALPLNQAVSVPVTIAVKDPGAHSAILVVEHPSLPAPAHRVLATVVAALPLSAENKYTASTTISLPKPTDRSVFVNVPAGTAALVVSATSPGGPARMGLVSPERQEISPCGGAPATGPCAVANPSPGVWEINLANNDLFTFDDTSSQAPKAKQMTVTATALRVDVDVSAGNTWAKIDGAATFPVRLINKFGTAPAATATSGLLGSGVSATRAIAQGEQHVYEIVVPKGATSLRARVAVADSASDLDVYLIDCTAPPTTQSYQRDNGGKAPPAAGANCAPRAKAASRESGGEVSVSDPKPGRWVVVVDAYAIPGGSASYDYFDAFTDGRFGAIAVADAVDDRSTGGSWTASAHAWTAAVPAAPRVLVGRIEVTSRGVTRAEAGAGGTRTLPVPIGAIDLFPGGRVMAPKRDRRN